MQIRQVAFQQPVNLSDALAPQLQSPESSPLPPREATSASGCAASEYPFADSYDNFFNPHSWLDARGQTQETITLRVLLGRTLDQVIEP